VECDGTYLRIQTCQSLGLVWGSLGWGSGCTFEVSS
jgi:hypothetical protein